MSSEYERKLPILVHFPNFQCTYTIMDFDNLTTQSLVRNCEWRVRRKHLSRRIKNEMDSNAFWEICLSMRLKVPIAQSSSIDEWFISYILLTYTMIENVHCRLDAHSFCLLHAFAFATWIRCQLYFRYVTSKFENW